MHQDDFPHLQFFQRFVGSALLFQQALEPQPIALLWRLRWPEAASAQVLAEVLQRLLRVRPAF